MSHRTVFRLFYAIVLATCLLLSSSVAFAASSSGLVVTPTSLNQNSTQCAADGAPSYTYHCSVSLSTTATSKGKINWTSSSSLSGVIFTPASGTLKQGQTVSVKIASIPCQAAGTTGTFTFSGQKGVTPTTASWSCSPPAPTLAVSPSSLDPTNAACALDATMAATYKCAVTLSASGSPESANWAATSGLNGVTFTPSSGTLQPGQSAQVTIDLIPCQNGTFTFNGQEGEKAVTVAWSCTPPTLSVSPTSLDQNSSNCSASGSTYQCTVTLGEAATSQGNVNWTASSDLSSASFSPANGTLSPGNSTTVTISSIPCQNGTFTFNGSGGANAISVTWSCKTPPPTITVSPTSLDPTNTTNCALDATMSATYKCTVTLGESSSSQGTTNWTSSSSLSGVSFSPSSGTLSPGGSTTVTIDQIPCQNGSFTFSGSEGETPVSVAWSCTPPTLTVSPTSMNNGMCFGAENASQCTVTLGETSNSQGNVNWAGSSDLSGVSFNPSSGTLSPGQSATITISSIPCQQGSFTFNGSGGASAVSVSWTCANWTQFGYDPQQTHFNPTETGLSPSSVSGLTLDWNSSVSTTNGSSPVVVNNLAYIGSADGYLVAVNVTSGAVVWKDYVASPTSPAEANGIVYAASQDHDYGFAGLWAMDAQTGAILWHNGSDFFGPPTVVNGIVYTVGNSSVSAFDATSGAVKWQYQGAGDNGTSPAMANGVVYADVSKNVDAFDAASGALLWSYTASYYVGGTPAVANGTVYVNLANSQTLALNASTGVLLWMNSNCGNASPAVANGLVYTSSGYSLCALNASTGAVVWTASVQSSQSGCSVVANGVVYYASGDNNVYAFDAGSGTKLWSYNIGGNSNPDSPVVVNGVLYIGGSNINLHAFHLPGTSP